MPKDTKNGTRTDMTGASNIPLTPDQLRAMLAQAEAAEKTKAVTRHTVPVTPQAQSGPNAAQLAELGITMEEFLAYPTAIQNAIMAKFRRSTKGLSLAVSVKGALSVFGLGRFPVTLYKEQWLRLLEIADEIRGFIAAHASELSVKE